MKALNAKAAVILITMGTVVLMVSVTPSQGGTTCMLTVDACAQIAAQAAQAAAVQFLEFFVSGIALISIAALLLISGRSRQPRTTLGHS